MPDKVMELPVIALRGLAILPGTTVHFDISRKLSINAAETAMMSKQKLFVVAQRDPSVSDPGMEDLYSIGTIVRVKQLVKLPNKLVRVLVEAEARGEINDFIDEPNYLCAEVYSCDDIVNDYSVEEAEARLRVLREAVQNYGNAAENINKETVRIVAAEENILEMLYQVILSFQTDYVCKQAFLEARTVSEQYDIIMEFLTKEIEINKIKEEIRMKVKERVDKNQREYILREQMKVIKEELGEDDAVSDADRFMEELGKLDAPDEVKEKIEKEIKRFRTIAPAAAESTVERNYIETLLEMPWNKVSVDNEDIDNAKMILDRDHYGLEKVKERVLEFLSVRVLTKTEGNGPIICLVGPPGTGKTSIAKSVAQALGKEYVRIALGGVRDEAEIRGHRKTYIGAMPGRIATGLKQAGTKNPLMLFDEIDKLGADYKGDPSSALLEVLDSEQNCKFRDNYIELPLDLSQVLFIATANNTQTIPKPLLDRMELIEVTSYTENEKLHIAKEHLVSKQIKKNGLKPEMLRITDGAMAKLIRNYTREAGVRNLERKIGELCRKAAREIVCGNTLDVIITEGKLENYLGKKLFTVDLANEINEVGIVRGLAWTSVGGDTLQIEVNVMPGKGEVMLTGSIGDVMKESAKAGLSYIRSISDKYRIDSDFFEKHDIHIHIPEGAVPKDGPSAGITMATAMLSAIINVPVNAKLAMTGEITLRGRVLPIGGLKEKILAAKIAGIETVLVPEKNRPDMDEISDEIKGGLNIIHVSSMEEVLKEALVRE
ncbi:MAG: endopeptidase La [Lachnospiraceae bacterium]|nr:endopeptidase La [Lachnospiraceae bacterium]